jgi:hypothetical protein
VVLLPEPVGPVTSRMPLGSVMIFRHCLSVLVAEAEFLEVDRRLVVIDDADDDFLAVLAGHRADAQVDRALVHADVDAAVLREAALRRCPARP